jgi:hypothetical protein
VGSAAGDGERVSLLFICWMSLPSKGADLLECVLRRRLYW